MIGDELNTLRINVKKAEYSGKMLKEAMPLALPLGIAESVVSMCTDFFNSTFLIQMILDRITDGNSFESLYTLFGIAITLNVFRLAVYVLHGFYQNQIDVTLEAKLKGRAYKRVGELAYSSQFDQNAKNLIYWSCGSIKGIAVLYYLAVTKYAAMVVSFLINVGFCLVYGRISGLVVVLLVCTVEIIAQRGEVKINQLNFDETQERNVFARKKAYFVNDIFLNKENNQSLRINHNFSFFEKKYLDYTKEDKRVAREYGSNGWKAGVGNAALRRVILIAVELGCLCFELLYLKRISVGAFWALFAAFGTVRTSCPIGMVSEAQKLGQYADMLKVFFEELETEKSGTRPVPDETVEIEFKDVTYSYPGSNTPAVNHLNLKINKDDMVVVLGENGAGKSTMLLLLYRLVEPQAGEITLNGVNIAEYDLTQYRNLFGTMFQDDNIYPMSLEKNVALEWECSGKSEQIKDALAEAGFGNKISKLAKGLETELTRVFENDGFVPSGGEARKIVFSRNVYTDAPIKFFDEYDSNIDPISEARLNQAIERIAGTKILITHRLPIAKKASKVLIMSKGTVMESGNHEELMQKKGLYYELMEAGKKVYEG